MTGQDISYLPISYTISSGDTLSGVIDKYATTVDNLMVWNTGWTIDSGLAV
jgi:LysM repeat protein